jgi:hypothetical protein
MLWSPAPAVAQYHGGYHGHSHSSFVVGVGFGYPYYPFYAPFYPFYSFGFGWGYPFYGGYPYYGYPYPGYYGNYWASVRTEIKPRNAQVFVDGYYVGLVDEFDGVFQRLDVPTGAHELAIYLPGYQKYQQKTLFRPGEGYHYKAVLQPLPPGTPDEPAPQPSANTPDPYSPPPPPRDPYARPGEPYGDPNRDPQQEPGRTQPLPDRSRPAPRPDAGGFGTLDVRVQPIDAVVVIDGEKWDSPGGGSRLSVQLAAGTHRIEVRKDGFKTYTSTVQIRGGETQSLNISLPGGGA